MQTKAKKIVLTVLIFVVGSVLLGLSRGAAPLDSAWLRIGIAVGAFYLLTRIWQKKDEKEKQ